MGDPSSGLLCLLFLNDILEHINSDVDGIMTLDDVKIFLLLFADDAALFAQNPRSLQLMLCDIETYCVEWGLKLNVNKTKCMIFEQGRSTNYDFYIYNTRIELVDSFKYLGVHLFKNNKWNRTQKRIASHAASSLHNLFITCKQLDLKTSQKLKLFDCLISPILNYSAGVWGYCSSKEIENIHTKFCRKLLYVKKSTNLNTLYGELGRVPMFVQRKIILIKYWTKIITKHENSLLYKTYEMLKRTVDNGCIDSGNWAYQIKLMLERIGLGNVWLEQQSSPLVLQQIERRIYDIYYQTWYANINNTPKLETYCIFKHNFEFEEYLDYINDKKLRIALTKIRVSSHDLLIEVGRYTNIPRNQRICQNCTMNVVESEYHFLLVCNKYRDIRKQFLKPYFCHWPTLQKFETLLCNKSRIVQKSIAKYICAANKLRNQLN